MYLEHRHFLGLRARLAASILIMKYVQTALKSMWVYKNTWV